MEGDNLVVEITNPPPIIPPEVQMEIFDWGFSTKSRASGYGLNIAKQSAIPTMEENE